MLEKNKQIDVIISTGQGRLHLIQSAKSIEELGCNVEIITGWIPSSFFSTSFLNFLGTLIGRKNLSNGLSKRKIVGFNKNQYHSCSFSEFYIQFLFLLSKYQIIKRDSAAISGWKTFGWQSKKYIKNADVFHVRSGAGCAGAIKKARKNNMKIVVDHSIAHPKEMYNQILKSLDGNKNDSSLNRLNKFWDLVLLDCKEADVLLVNSDYVKKSFIENGFSNLQIEVVPLGIDSKFWNLKKEYQIKEKTKLLFTGGFGRRKGAHLIVETFEKLINESDSYTLDVLGSVMDDFELPYWFTNHKDVTLHGHIPQEKMFTFLAESDIYIFPSYCEGAAQSLKEAMAAGLPVIATEQSGAPIIHNENGFVIKDNSYNALYSAIQDLEKDELLRNKIGKNAFLTISKEHTWDNYALSLNNNVYK